MTEMVLAWVSTYGYTAIFFLLVLGIAGLPVPDETLLTFTGYLIYKGTLHAVPAATTAYFGSVCGITLSYVLGRTIGLSLLHRYGKYIHLTEDRLAMVHNWFERYGRWTLFFGYYVPGVRHFTAYVAGASWLEYHRFALSAYAGALMWSMSFILLGYFVGEQWSHISEEIHGYLGTVAVVLVIVVAVFFVVRKLNAKRA
jgi:membrane protein DedA with SNARE-associated domain